jgi:hypothetical protein
LNAWHTSTGFSPNPSCQPSRLCSTIDARKRDHTHKTVLYQLAGTFDRLDYPGHLARIVDALALTSTENGNDILSEDRAGTGEKRE